MSERDDLDLSDWEADQPVAAASTAFLLQQGFDEADSSKQHQRSAP